MRSHGTALAAGSIQRGRSRFGRFSNCLPVPLIVMVALALSPTSSAVASEPITFAQTGEGAGQINNPKGMAVDPSSGNVYIADLNNRRIDEFNAAGGFVKAFGFGVRTGAAALETCTAVTDCIEGRRGLVAAGVLEGPAGIAASAGHIWVADGGLFRLTEFDSSGQVLRVLGWDVASSGPGNTGANAKQKIIVKATSGTLAGMFSLTATTAVGAGRTTAGSNVVTEVSNALGAFHVGDAITGAGIPTNTTITEVGTGTLTISANASQSTTSALTAKENTGATGTGNLTELSTSVTGVVTRTGGFANGERISGTGIPPGTTIVSGGGTSTLTLSNTVEAGKSGTGVVLTASDIPYNASEAEFKAAVEALPGVGSGNITASRVERSVREFEYTVTFTGGSLHGNEIATLAATNTNLEGTGKAATVSVLVTGGGPEVCVPTNGDICKGGKSGTANGQLQQPRSPLAVDGSGNLWVGDRNRVQKFAPDGTYLATVALAGHEDTKSLAVNSAGTKIYVISAAAAYKTSVRVYDTATGIQLGGPIDEVSGAFKTLALDSSENLFVADRQASGQPAVFRTFNPAGEQIGQFGARQVFGTGGPEGIAVGTGALYSNSFDSGDVFAAQRFQLPGPGPLISNEAATDILPTTATLNALIDPEGKETTYRFEYGRDETYGESTPVESLPAGFYDETVEASLSGLTPSTTYHFHVLAEDSEGRISEGPDRVFTTLPVVQIENESATDVSATAATFRADLDPLGPAAEWWVEYGSAEGYGNSTARSSLTAGFGPVPVNVRVSGLEPGTIYHYRFAAEDEREGTVYTVYGEDRTLTTQPGASPVGLLDGRAWEMVTPPAKSASVLPVVEQGEVEAAVGGGAFTYLTQGTPEEEAQDSRVSGQVLAMRDPSLGWRSHDLALPQDKVVGIRTGNLYPFRQFSPDLREAVVQQVPEDETLLSPEASEKTPYLRRQELCDTGASTCYTPLVSGREGYANVPAGTEFGDLVEYVGATSDLQHVVLKSSVALTADPAPGGGLYGWSASTRSLQLISVLPGGGPAPGADLGIQNHANVRNAISSDGSRVVFASESHLYLRDTAREETVQLDAVQGGIGSGPPRETVYQTASADGSRVFFTSEQKLTPGSGSVERKPDLYVCDLGIDETTGALKCSLTDLTPRTGAGEAAAVRGSLPGASEDGSRVYFVANAALAPGAVSGGCLATGAEASPSELCNLYTVRFAGGEWQAPSLVAVLSAEDRNDWSQSLITLTASVSAGGRWLAFMSNRSLTSFDNRDAVSGARDEQVFLYDAASGRLLCASCNPSGARPQGTLIAGSELEEKVDAQRGWKNRWLAANLPGWTSAALNTSILHQPRYLSGSGRLFFNSSDALVPRDGNGTWDAYEFEPAGVGDCTESDPRYAPGSGGCVALISSGRSGRVSTFMDASKSGDDVFFWTHAELVPQDRDTAADIYNAHVCSAASPCLPPPAQSVPCADATTCQGSVTPPPVTESPGTASFAGRGNLRPTRHHHRGKHHRKRHKRAHHRRVANHNRRVGR